MSETAFKPEYLSAPQQRALLNLEAGLDSFQDLHGRSAFGGHNATLRALARRGLVALSHETGATITEAGRRAAAAIAKAGGAS